MCTNAVTNQHYCNDMLLTLQIMIAIIMVVNVLWKCHSLTLSLTSLRKWEVEENGWWHWPPIVESPCPLAEACFWNSSKDTGGVLQLARATAPITVKTFYDNIECLINFSTFLAVFGQVSPCHERWRRSTLKYSGIL